MYSGFFFFFLTTQGLHNRWTSFPYTISAWSLFKNWSGVKKQYCGTKGLCTGLFWKHVWKSPSPIMTVIGASYKDAKAGSLSRRVYDLLGGCDGRMGRRSRGLSQRYVRNTFQSRNDKNEGDVRVDVTLLKFVSGKTLRIIQWNAVMFYVLWKYQRPRKQKNAAL